MASIEAAIDGKKENYISDSESEGEEGGNGGPSPGPGLPPPISDGLPQVREPFIRPSMRSIGPCIQYNVYIFVEWYYCKVAEVREST